MTLGGEVREPRSSLHTGMVDLIDITKVSENSLIGEEDFRFDSAIGNRYDRCKANARLATSSLSVCVTCLRSKSVNQSHLTGRAMRLVLLDR